MLFRFLTDNSPLLWCVSSCTRSQCVLLLSIFGLVFTCVCLWCSFASRGSPHELQRRKGFAEDKIKFLQSNPYGLAHLAGLRQEKKLFSFFSQCSLVASLIPYAGMWEAITIVEFVNPFSKHSHTIGEINRGGLNIAVCFGLIHLSLYYILAGFYFDFLVTSAYHRELNEPMNCTVFNCCTWLVANAAMNSTVRSGGVRRRFGGWRLEQPNSVLCFEFSIVW
jgi:uncharacterized membrane protein